MRIHSGYQRKRVRDFPNPIKEIDNGCNERTTNANGR